MPWHGFKAVIPALLKTFIKQAGDTETNTKLATRTFWVKVHVHIKKACGRRSGADCMSTFVCQPCKQPKWLSHPQAAGLVCSRPRLRWLPLIFFFFPEKISKAAIRRVTFPPVHHMPFVSAVRGEVHLLHFLQLQHSLSAPVLALYWIIFEYDTF